MGVAKKYGGLVKAGSAALGALSGAGLAVVTGEPFMSSAAGSTLGALLDDFGARRLSRAEEKRVLTVASAAARKIEERRTAGDEFRNDGFFEQGPTDRSTFEEIAEGVLVAAQREHQERKVPYLGNLVANLAYASIVDRATANLTLRVATEISWTQCVLLATVGREDRSFPDRLLGDSTGTWESWTVQEEFVDLHERRGLLGTKEPDGERSFPRFKWQMNEMGLSTGGQSLYQLMSLAEIPDEDLDELIVRLELPRPQAGE